MVTYVGDKTHPRMASVPFVGLAEAFVLATFRASGQVHLRAEAREREDDCTMRCY